MAYSIEFVYDHVEVLDEKGRFLFSADTPKEAARELERMELL